MAQKTINNKGAIERERNLGMRCWNETLE